MIPKHLLVIQTFLSIGLEWQESIPLDRPAQVVTRRPKRHSTTSTSPLAVEGGVKVGPRHECTSSTRSLSEGISNSCISDAGSLPREMTSNSKFVEATLMLSMVNAMTKSLRWKQTTRFSTESTVQPHHIKIQKNQMAPRVTPAT